MDTKYLREDERAAWFNLNAWRPESAEGALIAQALEILFSRLCECRKQFEANGWRCYHCGKVFTDPVLAAEHFGERLSPRPAACEGMLIAMAKAFEREGIHRNFHNAASVKLLADMWRKQVEELQRSQRTFAAEQLEASANRYANFYGNDTIAMHVSRWFLQIAAELKEE